MCPYHSRPIMGEILLRRSRRRGIEFRTIPPDETCRVSMHDKCRVIAGFGSRDQRFDGVDNVQDSEAMRRGSAGKALGAIVKEELVRPFSQQLIDRQDGAILITK